MLGNEALSIDTQPGDPEEGVGMRIFEAWMPVHPYHPMVLVTHKAICDRACARLVGVLASGAPSPGTGGPLQVGTGRRSWLA